MLPPSCLPWPFVSPTQPHAVLQALCVALAPALAHTKGGHLSRWLLGGWCCLLRAENRHASANDNKWPVCASHQLGYWDSVSWIWGTDSAPALPFTAAWSPRRAGAQVCLSAELGGADRPELRTPEDHDSLSALNTGTSDCVFVP